MLLLCSIIATGRRCQGTCSLFSYRLGCQVPCVESSSMAFASPVFAASHLKPCVYVPHTSCWTIPIDADPSDLLHLQVIDPVEDYSKVMHNIFDFHAIKVPRLLLLLPFRCFPSQLQSVPPASSCLPTHGVIVYCEAACQHMPAPDDAAALVECCH